MGTKQSGNMIFIFITIYLVYVANDDPPLLSQGRAFIAEKSMPVEWPDLVTSLEI
jgi:hypothetical protein